MKRNATFLALDIGATRIRAALVSEHQVIASRQAVWPMKASPADEVCVIASMARELITMSEDSDSIRAIGVSLAALVDRSGRVVHWPNRPAWKGLDFRARLSHSLALPIVIEDDANAAALGEWAYGAARGYRHVMVMTVGTGVGAGLILDGRLFRGRNGWAGEVGHWVMLQDGPECSCGHRGCLQKMASGRALDAFAAARDLPDGMAVSAAAERGERWALQALAECGRWLAIAAANAVNLLDLEAVVIGGRLSCAGGNSFWASLQETLAANLLNARHRVVALRRAELPETAGLIGAAILARHLSEPETLL